MGKAISMEGMKISILIICSLLGRWHIMASKSPELSRIAEDLSDRGYFRIMPFNKNLSLSLVLAEIADLNLPSTVSPQVIIEVANKVYSDRGLGSFEAGISSRLDEIFNYSFENGLWNSKLTFEELFSLSVKYPCLSNIELSYGPASTNPLILDFDQNIGWDHSITIVRKNLFNSYEQVLKALERGMSHDIIATFLEMNLGSLLIGLPSSIYTSKEAARLLCRYLVRFPNYRKSRQGRPIFDTVEIQNYFLELTKLPEPIAIQKLFLMINFPHCSHEVFENPPIVSLKSILMRGISGYRRVVAAKMNWGHGWLKRLIPSLYDYNGPIFYDGFLEDRIFDSILHSFDGYKSLSAQFKEVFNTQQSPADFLSQYYYKVILEEKQGIVYAILQNRYGLIGQVDLSGDKVDKNFEDQIIGKISQSEEIGTHWLKLQFTENIVGVPISRLCIYPCYSLHHFLDHSLKSRPDHFRDNIAKLYHSIAEICGLSGDLPLNTEFLVLYKSDHVSKIFLAIWNGLANQCLDGGCIQSIMNHIEFARGLIIHNLLLCLLTEAITTNFPLEMTANISSDLKKKIRELLPEIW